MKHFYTYAYLRKNKTPYYIGKGKDDRAYRNHRHIPLPRDKQGRKDRSRILILKKNLNEEKALNHEAYMINVFGRKCDGGILLNRTLGGKATEGFRHSEETKAKMKGRPGFWTGKKRPDLSKKLQKSNPRSIPVTLKCIKTGEVKSFISLGEAERYTGAQRAQIRFIMKGKYKQAKGWTFVS